MVDHALPHAIETFFVVHSEALACGGSVVTSWRGTPVKRRGPYYRLVCRTGGRKQVSVYVPGKYVQAVELRLNAAQATLQRSLRRRQARKSLLAAYRRCQRELDTQLDAMGLYRKGSEIRGWSRNRGAVPISRIVEFR